MNEKTNAPRALASDRREDEELDEDTDKETDEELPLPEGAPARMAERLGLDPGAITLHRGAGPAGAAAASGARAFADGDHIHFGDGELDPGSPAGEELIAHELVHVAQARSAGSAAGSREASEEEADRGVMALRRGAAPRVSALATAGPHFKRPTGPKVVGPVEIRRAWLAARYQAQAAVKDTQGAEGTAATTRRQDALRELHAAVSRHGADLDALRAEDKNALAPVLRSILDVAGELNAGFVGPVQAMLGLKELGQRFGVAMIAAQWRDGDATRGERVKLAAAALAEAKAELGAEVASDAAQLGTGGLGALARARELLAGNLGPDEMAARERLQPVVKDVTRYVMALKARFDAGGGGHLGELLVRVSDVRQAVLIPDRVDARSMGQLVKDEEDAGRGYTPEDAARFDAEAGKVGIALRSMLLDRLEGVDVVEKEANLPLPPAKTSIWEDLAWAALEMAAGKIMGAIIGKVVGKVMGGSPTELQLAKEIAKAVGDKPQVARAGERLTAHKVLSGLLEKGAAKGISKGIEAIREDPSAPDKPQGEASRDPVGGGGASGDPKIAFFSAQRTTLNRESEGAETAALELALQFRPALAADPAAAIAGMKGAVEPLVHVKAQAKEIQTASSRAQYLALLTTLQLGEVGANDAALGEQAKKNDGMVEIASAYAAKEELARRQAEDKTYGKRQGTDMSDAVAVESTMASASGLQNEHNVNGLLSMEFEAGERPQDPVRVVRAWIRGVSDKMYANLEQLELNQQRLPMRARGTFRSVEGVVSFARNEKGEVWASASDEGTAWCERRVEGGLTGERALRAAGEQILREIGEKSLAGHGVKLKV